LPQPSREVRGLGKFLNKVISEYEEVYFIVTEQSREVHGLGRIQFSHRTVAAMIREGMCHIGRVSFRVASKIAPTQIFLCFGSTMSFLISGFPRSLFADDSQSSRKCDVSQSDETDKPLTKYITAHRGLSPSNSYHYVRGSRRVRVHTPKWVPPDLQATASISDLRQYADPLATFGSDVVDARPFESPSTSQGTTPMIGDDQIVPIVRPPSPALEQKKSASSIARRAFRALLWPVRARTPKETYPRVPLYLPPRASTPNFGSAYYQVDSRENEVYQHWVASLQTASSGSCPDAGLFAESPQGIFEMPGDQAFPVEMSQSPTGDHQDPSSNLDLLRPPERRGDREAPTGWAVSPMPSLMSATSFDDEISLPGAPCDFPVRQYDVSGRGTPDNPGTRSPTEEFAWFSLSEPENR